GGVGCSSSSVSYSKDWSGNPLLTVTQTGDRLDLVGIDRTSGRSGRLAALPVKPAAYIVPQAAALDRDDGTWLLVIQDGNGFEGQVLAVRPAARSVATGFGGRGALPERRVRHPFGGRDARPGSGVWKLRAAVTYAGGQPAPP